MARYFVMKVTPVYYAVPGPLFEKSEDAVTFECLRIYDSPFDAFEHAKVANRAHDDCVYLHHYAVFVETQDGFELEEPY